MGSEGGVAEGVERRRRPVIGVQQRLGRRLKKGVIVVHCARVHERRHLDGRGGWDMARSRKRVCRTRRHEGIWRWPAVNGLLRRVGRVLVQTIQRQLVQSPTLPHAHSFKNATVFLKTENERKQKWTRQLALDRRYGATAAGSGDQGELPARGVHVFLPTATRRTIGV